MTILLEDQSDVQGGDGDDVETTLMGSNDDEEEVLAEDPTDDSDRINFFSSSTLEFVADVRLWLQQSDVEVCCKQSRCIKKRDWYHMADGKPQPLSDLPTWTWTSFVTKIHATTTPLGHMTRNELRWTCAIYIPFMVLWIGMMSLPSYEYSSGEPVVDGNAPWYIATFCAVTLVLFAGIAWFIRMTYRRIAVLQKEVIANMQEEFQRAGFVVEYVVCRKCILGCPMAFGRFYHIINNDGG